MWGTIFALVAGVVLIYSGALPIKGLQHPQSNWSRAAGIVLIYGTLGERLGLGVPLHFVGSLFGNEYYGRPIVLVLGMIMIVIGTIHGMSQYRAG